MNYILYICCFIDSKFEKKKNKKNQWDAVYEIPEKQEKKIRKKMEILDISLMKEKFSIYDVYNSFLKEWLALVK